MENLKNIKSQKKGKVTSTGTKPRSSKRKANTAYKHRKVPRTSAKSETPSPLSTTNVATLALEDSQHLVDEDFGLIVQVSDIEGKKYADIRRIFKKYITKEDKKEFLLNDQGQHLIAFTKKGICLPIKSLPNLTEILTQIIKNEQCLST